MSVKQLKMLGLGATAVVALALSLARSPSVPQSEAPPPEPADFVEPQTALGWMLGSEQAVRLVDLRPESEFLQTGIRGAISLPLDSISPGRVAALPSGHLLVLYGDGGEDGVEGFRRVRALRDGVLILHGGYPAWESRILEPERPPEGAAADTWEAYAERLAVSNYLLGKTDSAPLPERSVVAPVLRPRSHIKNEGC